MAPAHDIIELQVYAHGLSSFNDWTRQLWPVSDSTAIPGSSVSPIGLTDGNSRLMDVQEFLKDAVNELKVFLRNGICLRENNKTFQVIWHSIVANAPDQAFLKQVKQHSR